MPAPKINPSYNVLNKIEKPYVAPRLNTDNYNAMDVQKNIVREHYTPNALANTGPYKGIVLRVENNTLPQAGSWISNFFSSVGEVPKLVRIKVRIPEIHSMLPIPRELGNASNDRAIIDMYPTFLAQSDEPIPEPEVGTLVWVDFGNKINFTDPIYIKPVNFKAQTPGASGQGSAADAFTGCPGVLNSDPPLNDEMGGKNKPLSHSGLPLLPRKPANALVGESVLLKTNEFNAITVATWKKEIKANGVPSKSWIGCLSSNGGNDTSHKLGKRETIICAPNVCDFTIPIELIYYFHGYKEFNGNGDFKRYAENIKQMVTDGRNFILVIPELTWSSGAKESKAKENSSSGAVWRGTDNFASFDREVMKTIKESVSDDLNVTYKSIIAGNLGLKSISAEFNNGADGITISRVALTEFNQNAYSIFLDKVQEVDLVVIKGSKDEKEFNSFQSSEKGKINFKSLSVDNKTLSSMIIPYVPEEKDNLKNKLDSKLPGPKNADVSPSVKPKVTMGKVSQVNGALVADAVPFREARVKVDSFGSLQGSENILAKVPSVSSQQLLHVLAAKRFNAMSNAWSQENPSDPPILISSGFRKRAWASLAEYEVDIRKRYPGKTVEEARKLLAYQSPHETGLAFDIGGTNGLSPNSKTIPTQRKTKLFNWLMNNAHKFGITPYSVEPWHWEINLPRESWASGKEFTDNLAVRVESPGKGGNMPMANGILNQNCIATIGDVPVGGNPNNPNGEIGKPLAGAPELKLLWSTFAKGVKPPVADLLSRAKIVDQKWGDSIKKYQGDVPYGLICVRIGHETRGNPNIVTPCCGETGLLQVWTGSKYAQTKNMQDATGLGAKCAQKMPGFDPLNPSMNIWCGMSDWNLRGHKMSVRLSKYFPTPDVNFWACVNMGMNIGEGAIEFLLKKSNPTPGNALNELCEWIVKTGPALANYKARFGSQSPESIARRILVVPYWIEAARQLTGKDLLSSNFGQDKFLKFA
ncbi:MAG: D-alanyl-D-alanine carboxypeptidase family protein [Nanoarchaeota archaeon]|nr:D-alanyl-D-alanine carboxypeptidase family protein [Nanoarchaeota archaeon]